MKKFFAGITSILLIAGLAFYSCDTGLGEEVDLEAPVIGVTKLTSDNTELTFFSGGVYCKKSVTFTGIATDNKKVERVYAQLKWSGEDEFVTFAYAAILGNTWEMPLNFEKEGVAIVRFVAEDAKANISPKSTKTLILFVDDTAPVASAWYIDREINGIQYNLRDKEALQALNLDLTENKDAAQNVAFTIHAATADTMGVGAISIQIRDENGNKVCSVLNSASSDYAPQFRITHDDLVAGDPGLATGKHYLQVWYDTEDVVTVPESNKAENVAVEGGWFIWWPESDEPRIVNSEIISENGAETLNLHIKDALSLSIFDDDMLEVAYAALLSESENSTFTAAGKTWDDIIADPSIIISAVSDDETERANRTAQYNAKENERDTTVVFKAAGSPQKMRLLALAYDKTAAHRQVTKDITVNVIDDTAPILLITSPKNNAIPGVDMKGTTSHAYVSIEGQTLDSVGCKYLELVWVPDAVTTGDKTAKAKEWLDTLTTDAAHDALKADGQVKKTTKDGLTLWSVPLTDAGMNGTFIKHTFAFEVDLFDDFGDEKAKDKAFVAKLTRKDGNYIYQDYKLMADTLPPDILPITPSGDMQIIQSGNSITLEFKGVKDSKLGMDTEKYSITPVGSTLALRNAVAETTPHYDPESGTYKVTIPAEDITAMQGSGIQPRYEFVAVDLFGNEGKAQYTMVISNLPSLKSITSPSATLCKLGDDIIINATFTNTVNVTDGNPYIELQGIDGSATNSDKAYYTSGSGSTTLTFTYTVQKGDYSDRLLVAKEQKDETYFTSPIIANGATGLASSAVYLDTLIEGEFLQDKKTIKIDGVPPQATQIAKTSDGNTVGDTLYLREGTTLTVTVTADDSVSVQGSPAFVFTVDGTKTISLPFTGYGDNNKEITFSKKIAAQDPNGTLTCTKETCISGCDTIVDEAGNALDVSTLNVSAVSGKIVIDTVAPDTPTITNTASGSALTSGKYKNSVTFALTTEAGATTEYSVDGGSTWEDYTATSQTLSASAQLTARAKDKAGNVSAIAPILDLDINSTFPDFTVECMNPDGNYKAGSTLTFRVTFASKVKVASNAGAYIFVRGIGIYGNGANNGKALLSSDTAYNTEVSSVTFIYTAQDPDQFTLGLAAGDVHLDGITDLYGITQGSNQNAAYERSGIKCDGVPPRIKTMSPGGQKNTSNVYTSGNVITITFAEPVQKASGNITLRQVAGWAIPPVLTATDFNTICGAVSSDDKNILSMQENGKDMEDSESLLQADVGPAQDKYHGRGQYVGPYKKATQGLKLSGGNYVPDVSTKYVLDFDIDIWETTETHPIGKTFQNGYAASAGFQNQSRTGLVNVITPSTTRSAQQLRTVLEKAHYHERILDVTSSYVAPSEQDATTGGYKKFTITFPAGLCDTSAALPVGREWELVIDKGAFMDMTGNEFGAEADGTIKAADAVQTPGTGNSGAGAQTSDLGTWARGRTATTDTPVVLIKTDSGNTSYWSDGVATPVVRVDRYSYALGMKQSDENGSTTTPIATDAVKPTGYVRVRIDCETKGATITYDKSGKENTRNDGEANDTVTTNRYVNTDNRYCYSYYTVTGDLSSSEFTSRTLSTKYTGIFAGGNGSYNKSYKQYIIAAATKSGFTDSARGLEGVYQTVVHMVNPTAGDQSSWATEATMGTGKTDVSIRGTTGFAGEPYISPFPLRDSQIASPYLQRCYRERANISTSTDYYWVSYEILVDSSFSNYSWANNWRQGYNWAQNWGLMKPGEFTRCVNMANWE